MLWGLIETVLTHVEINGQEYIFNNLTIKRVSVTYMYLYRLSSVSRYINLVGQKQGKCDTKLSSCHFVIKWNLIISEITRSY